MSRMSNGTVSTSINGTVSSSIESVPAHKRISIGEQNKIIPQEITRGVATIIPSIEPKSASIILPNKLSKKTSPWTAIKTAVRLTPKKSPKGGSRKQRGRKIKNKTRRRKNEYLHQSK